MNHSCQWFFLDCWWLQPYWMQSITLQACRYINQALEGLLVLIRGHCLVFTPSNQRERLWSQQAFTEQLSLSFSLIVFFNSTSLVCTEIKECAPKPCFVSFFSLFWDHCLFFFFVLLFACCDKCLYVVINYRLKGYSLLSCRC